MLGFFHRNSLLPLLLALGLIVAWPAPGFGTETFTSGIVFWAPGDCFGACEVFDVTGGGDLGTAAGFATVDRSPGQIAWSQDLSSAYITEFSQDRVSEISTTGTVSLFFSGISRPTGLLRTADNRLLAASFNDGAVYDISGGDASPPETAFATGLGGARNLLQLATGEILVADQNLKRIIDISAGGSFGTELGFAFGIPGSGPFDLVEDASGRIYASSFSGVFDITAGGDLSGESAYATGFNFVGLTIDGSGRMLASVHNSGVIYDVTDGGNVSSDIPFAFNLPGFADTALDVTPAAAPPPAVPALSAWGWWSLICLLLLAGAMLAGSETAETDRQIST
jgi:DNA-binding beta-propeller fold protein YncE